MKTTRMFCLKYKSEHRTAGYFYSHFYPNVFTVDLCRDKDETIFEVTVSETEEKPDSYWAWWDLKDNRFEFVYYDKLLVKMCFPYEISLYINKGEGLLLPVSITIIKEVQE